MDCRGLRAEALGAGAGCTQTCRHILHCATPWRGVNRFSPAVSSCRRALSLLSSEHEDYRVYFEITSFGGCASGGWPTDGAALARSGAAGRTGAAGPCAGAGHGAHQFWTDTSAQHPNSAGHAHPQPEPEPAATGAHQIHASASGHPAARPGRPKSAPDETAGRRAKNASAHTGSAIGSSARSGRQRAAAVLRRPVLQTGARQRPGGGADAPSHAQDAVR